MFFYCFTKHRYGNILYNTPSLTLEYVSFFFVHVQYDSHFVPAWTYNIDAGKSKSMDEAITDLKKVLANTPRAEIIKSEPVKSDQGSGYYGE